MFEFLRRIVPDLRGPDVLNEPQQIVLALLIFAWVFRWLYVGYKYGDAIEERDDEEKR